jgi:tetratricopeptide (TPR) repeat protein
VECIAYARSIGDPKLLVDGLANLATILHARGDAERAFQALEEALVLVRDRGDEWLLSHILTWRGRVACKEGMLALAEESLVESLTIARALADDLVIAAVLESFAELALAKQAPERAARHYGAAAHLREEVEVPIPIEERADYQKGVVAARAALGDDAFERAWSEGRAMTLDEAVRCARAEDG